MVDFSNLTFEEINYLVNFMFNWLTYLTLFVCLITSVIFLPKLGDLLCRWLERGDNEK